MTRATDPNDTDESTQNDETPQIGRICDYCGGFYVVVTICGPEGGDARRGCGCPVTVVSTTDDGLRADGGTSSDGTERLPDQCQVCNNEMRETLTPGEKTARCTNCGWRWSA